jgi:hypothetical protein
LRRQLDGTLSDHPHQFFRRKSNRIGEFEYDPERRLVSPRLQLSDERPIHTRPCRKLFLAEAAL